MRCEMWILGNNTLRSNNCRWMEEWTQVEVFWALGFGRGREKEESDGHVEDCGCLRL